ncbi:MAG: penicillin-binding protein 2 [Gammaproteobacteria bacterium]|nr:penicillin-binding protein 2 [Gammaproteobacteria bacterium]
MNESIDGRTNSEGSELRSFGDRVLILVVLGFLMLIIVLGRLVYLQIYNHEAYQTQSLNNRIQIQSIAPPRGLIFDTNGEILADNRQILSLALVPERIDGVDALFAKLSELIELAPGELQAFKERIRGRPKHDPIILKRDLTDKEQAQLAVNRHELDGAVVTYETIRHYLYGEKFVHAIGTVRRIAKEDLDSIDRVNYRATQFIGGTGVERFYESSLHGTVGSRSVEVDASGRPTREQPEDLTPPKRGASLTLYIDSKVQLAADAALGDRRGAIVAIDPQTGGILALVSKPTYDPNQMLSGTNSEEIRQIYDHRDKPVFNRAVQGNYAPGSTFKPVVGLMALSEKITDWNEVIVDEGNFNLPGSEQVYRSWNRTSTSAGGHGRVDMHRGIYRSSNVYFYTIASRMSVDGLADFVSQRFGLGRRTIYDLYEAGTGVLPTREWKLNTYNERWYPGDSVILGIGQGYINVTPLQLATMATVLANRGAWVQPRMLKRSDQRLVEVVEEPEPRHAVLEPADMAEHWERMALAMSAVVHRGNRGLDQNGTAWAYIGINIPYTMAGKSGTAQVIESAREGEELDDEERDEYERNHALFIAFAPFKDPEIAVAVVVENGGGGSKEAAPVARAVIDAKLLSSTVVAQND